MLFEKINQACKTLAFRLTVYYAAIFTLSLVAAFAVVYFMTSSVLLENMDEDLLEDVEEYVAMLSDEGEEPLLDELHSEDASESPEEFFFRLMDQDGTILLASDLDLLDELEPEDELVKAIKAAREPYLETRRFAKLGHDIRVVHAQLASGHFLQMGESFAEQDEILEIIVEVSIQTLLALLFLSVIFGWWMARRALVGVEEVTQTARQISKGNFAHRVPLKARGLEIERLATTFNYMLDRINALITGIREVTDNIAHDLRSPITSIRGTAETTLMTAETLENYRRMTGNTIEECDRLLEMINAMLDISEAEAGAEKYEMVSIDLTRVVNQACELFRPLAEDKGLVLSVETPHRCVINGDTRKIQRLIANLLDNALKYTPTGGAVIVSVICDEDNVEVRVNDTGIGIAESELTHIFQRFYRCDQSRTEEGTGLGLSLALAIAKAHGGAIKVQSMLGKGSSFILKLPINAQ